MKKIKAHFHLIIIILIVFLVMPVAYYFLYALPSYNAAKLELEKQKYKAELRIMDEVSEEKMLLRENEERQRQMEKEEEIAQTEALNNCIEKAKWTYEKTQDHLFEKGENQDCKTDLVCLTFINEQLDDLEIDLKNGKDECYKKYHVN